MAVYKKGKNWYIDYYAHGRRKREKIGPTERLKNMNTSDLLGEIQCPVSAPNKKMTSPKRQSVRLKDYDYAREGAYYVTVCTNDRKYVFGDVENGEMVLNEYGKIADKCWNEIPEHFPHIALDEYIVMPNHVHGVIIITNSVGANDYSPLRMSKTTSAQSIQRPHGTSKTIGSVIRGFKIGVTKWVRQNMEIENIWQRNFYDHIIRDEQSLNKIREYIVNNPGNWKEDKEYIAKR